MPYAVDQADTVPEIVRNLLGPKTSGVTILPGIHVEKKALGTATAAGGVFSWQNPLDVAAMAMVIMDITTAGPATRTIDIGVAADGTTLSDTLIDGVAADATGVVNSFDQKGTNGRGFRKVDEKGGTNDFINGSSVAAGALTGLVGSVYILYFPIS